MVTRNRARLARRAIACFAAQTWPARELVIVDDGDDDLGAGLAGLGPALTVRHLRMAHDPARRLGDLRNVALDAATGPLVAQWDDDEWYHPERLRVQVEALHRLRTVAVVLQHTLMHLDTPAMIDRPFRADAGGGTPGTVLHRRSSVRYPGAARGEDSAFLAGLRQTGPVAVLGRRAHLFIRCFHGGNTWDERHFLRRLWRTPRGALAYVAARARGDLFSHPAFALDAAERGAAAQFLSDSRRLGLFRS